MASPFLGMARLPRAFFFAPWPAPAGWPRMSRAGGSPPASPARGHPPRGRRGRASTRPGASTRRSHGPGECAASSRPRSGISARWVDAIVTPDASVRKTCRRDSERIFMDARMRPDRRRLGRCSAGDGRCAGLRGGWRRGSPRTSSGRRSRLPASGEARRSRGRALGEGRPDNWRNSRADVSGRGPRRHPARIARRRVPPRRGDDLVVRGQPRPISVALGPRCEGPTARNR